MRGATWGVGSVRTQPGAEGYSRAFAREVLSNIRTDLDAFNGVEAGVLMNHGYLSAAAAIAVHVPELQHGVVDLRPPYPDLLPPMTDEVGLRVALKGSGTRKTLGRG